MAGYNVRVIEYPTGEIQLRYYSVPFHKDGGLEEYEDELNHDILSYENEIKHLEEPCPFGSSTEFVEMDKEDVIDEDERAAKHAHSVSVSCNRSKSKLYDYARSNNWEYFFTFTLDDNSVEDRFDYSACSKKVTKFLNNMRSRFAPDLKYLIVPEEHLNGVQDEFGRYAWHFHALVSNIGSVTLVEAINQQKFYKGKPNKYYGQVMRSPRW